MVSCAFLQCYVILCYVLCYMLCYVMLCYVILSCNVMSYHGIRFARCDYFDRFVVNCKYEVKVRYEYLDCFKAGNSS